MINNQLLKCEISRLWLLLKITYSLGFIGAGLDKFFYFITDWNQYINSPIFAAIGADSTLFFSVIAIIEIVIGIALLANYTSNIAYIAAVWLLLKAVYLFTVPGYGDSAMRHIVIAIGAITLARLTHIKDKLLA